MWTLVLFIALALAAYRYGCDSRREPPDPARHTVAGDLALAGRLVTVRFRRPG